MWRQWMTIAHGYRMAILHSRDERQEQGPFTRAGRILKAHFKHGLDARLYSLFDLANVGEEHWPDYMLDKPFQVKTWRVNAVEMRRLGQDKLLFYRHCQKHRLPTIAISAVMPGRGPVDAGDLPLIRCADDLMAAFQSGEQPVFFKLIDSFHGRKAFVARRQGVSISAFDQTFSRQDFYNRCRNLIADEAGWLIQPCIRNHPAMQSYLAAGLCTIRVITLIENGKVDVIAACARITTGKNVVDNFSHGRLGNLVAAVELPTGVLRAARGSVQADWPVMQDVSVHPDTSGRIEGQRLPHWDNVMQLVTDAHLSMPGLKTTGWDIAITEQGPVIVETNPSYDVDIVQVAYREGFRSRLEHRLGA